MISRLFVTLLFAAVAAAQQASFRAQTTLVLLSFHVKQGQNFVRGLEARDVTLSEDGKPRPFTIFDSPETQGRMPLEFVLLFDDNPAIKYFWDPAEVFRFVPQWTEGMTRQFLEKQDADVRISVYVTTGQKLYRLTGAATDAVVVTRAFRALLNTSYGAAADADIPLALPAMRDKVGRGRFTGQFQTSHFVSDENRGWPMEAAIGTLTDVAAAQEKVSRGCFPKGSERQPRCPKTSESMPAISASRCIRSRPTSNVTSPASGHGICGACINSNTWER